MSEDKYFDARLHDYLEQPNPLERVKAEMFESLSLKNKKAFSEAWDLVEEYQLEHILPQIICICVSAGQSLPERAGNFDAINGIVETALMNIARHKAAKMWE